MMAVPANRKEKTALVACLAKGLRVTRRAGGSRYSCESLPESGLDLDIAPGIDRGAGGLSHCAVLCIIHKDASNPVRQRVDISCWEAVPRTAIAHEIDGATAPVTYDGG